MLKLVLLISKGLVRDATARRTLMFYVLLAALVMLFLGSTVFWSWRSDHPLLFLAYWAGCAWITILAMLLAVFDILMVRASGRRERRKLETEYMERTRQDLENT